MIPIINYFEKIMSVEMIIYDEWKIMNTLRLHSLPNILIKTGQWR